MKCHFSAFPYFWIYWCIIMVQVLIQPIFTYFLYIIHLFFKFVFSFVDFVSFPFGCSFRPLHCSLFYLSYSSFLIPNALPYACIHSLIFSITMACNRATVQLCNCAMYVHPFGLRKSVSDIELIYVVFVALQFNVAWIIIQFDLWSPILGGFFPDHLGSCTGLLSQSFWFQSH